MRRLLIALLLVLPALPALPASAARTAFPAVIALPDGWQPEGIANGRGSTFYAGSLADGAIYRGDLRTGEGGILVPGEDGTLTVGVYVDTRSNALFAATGLNGGARVYDAGSGEQLAAFDFTAPFAGFINDVVVTRDAAYFTDSFNATLYRIPLGPAGRVDAFATPQPFPLTGDWVQVPDNFNANGIEATRDGRWLLVVNSTTGDLYRVDPATGFATAIDLGGEKVTSGDGIRLSGRTLYVVRNFLNQIAVVELGSDFLSGTVSRTITNPAFDVPTTIASFGSSLYAVNARFSTTPGPDTPYQVVRVPRN